MTRVKNYQLLYVEIKMVFDFFVPPEIIYFPSLARCSGLSLASEFVLFGLVTYTNGCPRATDLDSVSQSGEKFVVIEAKRIFKGDLSVPRGQFMTLVELHRQLKQSHFFIAGTDCYGMCKPEDIMYYTDFKKILTKEIPHSYDKYGNLVLNVKDMNPISRKGFSAICDNILK